jgi:hypothetical protein
MMMTVMTTCLLVCDRVSLVERCRCSEEYTVLCSEGDE